MEQAKQKTSCYHCGEDCVEEHILHDGHDFCCHGCKAVYTMLNDTGLISYYDIEPETLGPTVKSNHANKDFLELEEGKRQFIDFTELIVRNRNDSGFFGPPFLFLLDASDDG